LTVVEDRSATQENPAWSGDGSKIVFVESFPDGFRSLWVVNADGSNRRRVLASSTTRYPTWSPQSSTIALGGGGVRVINEDGSGLRSVVPDSFRVDRAVWSPDGTRMAFGAAGADFLSHDIWLVNSDGSGLIRITTGAKAYFPTWSPDGTQIAFGTSDFSTPNTIQVINADGSNQRQLYSGANAGQPAWSRKTNLIAFNLGGGPGRIWIMKPDGTDLHVLNTGSVDTDRDPSWRP
jgi:Tol biopolymer transport system component